MKWDKHQFDRGVRELGKRLTHAEHRVLITMASYADSDGAGVFVSVKRLAENCGMTKETVIAARRSLEAKHLIRCTHVGGGRKNPSRYRILNVPAHLQADGKKGPAEGGVTRQQSVGSVDPFTEEKGSGQKSERVGSERNKGSDEPERTYPVTYPIDQAASRARAREDDPGNDRAVQLVREAIPDSRYSQPTLQGLRGHVRQMLSEGRNPNDIRVGLRSWESRTDAYSPNLLPYLVDDAVKAGTPTVEGPHKASAFERKSLANLKLFLSAGDPSQKYERDALITTYGEYAVTALEQEEAGKHRAHAVVDGQVLDVTYEPELPAAQGDT